MDSVLHFCQVRGRPPEQKVATNCRFAKHMSMENYSCARLASAHLSPNPLDYGIQNLAEERED